MKSLACPKVFLTLIILAGIGCFCGCEQKNEYVPPPPPPVTVMQPEQKDVTDYADFTGTARATESVELRARVKGFLERINFQEGALVKQGELLFVIDPKPFQAALDQAKADLQAKQAELARARIEYRRNQRLAAQNAASERQLVETKAAQETGEAAVAAAKAKVEEADLNLGYTHITAPISGMITRSLVDKGNLVGASENTLLATIYKIEPIYAFFNVSEREILEYMEKAQQPEKPSNESSHAVYLGLANETGYPHKGEINYIDPYVDPDTGTVQVRGIFPNADRRILPGMFVRVRIPIGVSRNALLISERAIGADQGGHFVLTVNKEDVVEQRQVELGALVDGMRVVTKGIDTENWVIVSGIQRARPGSKVNPTKESAISQTTERAPSKKSQPTETASKP
ncbi:MAG: efflux RND transporter periplasmic adaptor subunit [Desulfoferrobacter sp.]